jgi:hypothetical protein
VGGNMIVPRGSGKAASVNFGHFERLWIGAADTTPDRVGDDNRFGRLVRADIDGQEKRLLGSMLFTDVAPAEATRRMRILIADPAFSRHFSTFLVRFRAYRELGSAQADPGFSIPLRYDTTFCDRPVGQSCLPETADRSHRSTLNWYTKSRFAIIL